MVEDLMEEILKRERQQPILQKTTLPYLRASIKELLEQVVNNHELDRHW